MTTIVLLGWHSDQAGTNTQLLRFPEVSSLFLEIYFHSHRWAAWNSAGSRGAGGEGIASRGRRLPPRELSVGSPPPPDQQKERRFSVVPSDLDSVSKCQLCYRPVISGKLFLFSLPWFLLWPKAIIFDPKALGTPRGAIGWACSEPDARSAAQELFNVFVHPDG